MKLEGRAELMGTVIGYDIANVVDPNFTVAAKMRKAMPPR